MTDLLHLLHREGIYLWYYFTVQLEQIFLYWVLGMFLGSVVSVFFKERIGNAIASWGDRKSGPLSIGVAAALGIASPVCMYGTIPVAASLSESGIKDDWLAAFMMSSILLNPQLLIYSAALGHTVLIIRIVSSLLCGCVAGLAVRFFYRNNSFFSFDGFALPESRDTDPAPLLRLIKNLGRNVKATGGYFLIGVVLSALFQRYVPAEAMIALFGGNEAFGVLMAAAIGVPLYVCGGGTIPLLQAWLYDGMSLGSAAAFMITGSTTKITNLGAVKIVLGARRFLFYLVFTTGFALVTGFLINAVFYG